MGCQQGKCQTSELDEAYCAVTPTGPGKPAPGPSDCMGLQRLTECNRYSVRQRLRDYLPTFEMWACSNTPSNVPTECIYRCAQCKMDTKPNAAETIQTLM
eukprot:15509399-Heterocapsa_arctica.AAC.1